MAFSTGNRFPLPPTNYRLFEPAAYQNYDKIKIKPNKAPFLSKTERNTHSENRIWTHTLYNASIPPKIPNCTSMMSKRIRFPYEALTKEDMEAILCKCGVQSVCECLEEVEQDAEVICQGKKHKRLYKGHPPKSVIAEGLSVPSRRDRGFEELPDGSYRRMLNMEQVKSPPFYDNNVIESTAFYQGCKWSHWKTTRSFTSQEIRPGPADYSITRQPTHEYTCAEKLREKKRRTSKQLRFIEHVQQKEILEGRPGPASYNPKYPSGTELSYLGSKANRFQKLVNKQQPGPSDYMIQRDFDLTTLPSNPCLAKLPEPSFFGVRSKRFKHLKEEGPSPASYNPIFKQCNLMHCSTAPFGSSSARFTYIPFDDNNELVSDIETKQDCFRTRAQCPQSTWQFKSKTIRILPLRKNSKEQSPADLPMSNIHVQRTMRLQYMAPFFTSEGRFQPWHNWMPVKGKLKIPGPGYYNPESSRCLPAFSRGPLFRAGRFLTKIYNTPAPNEYNIRGGVESICTTHNQKLKKNIENKHKFVWKPSIETKKLPLEEQENLLLQKSIALLAVDADAELRLASFKDEDETTEMNKPKLLRCFLYNNPVVQYF